MKEETEAGVILTYILKNISFTLHEYVSEQRAKPSSACSQCRLSSCMQREQHQDLRLFSRCGLEPRSWAVQVWLEYPIMIWPHVCKLPEPNIGKRRGKVPPAFCVWQAWLSLLTHSSKISVIMNPAIVKSLCSAAGEGAMHRLLPFAFVLHTFDSIPAKTECKGVGGERMQQGLRSQRSACGYMFWSHGMTNFHF